MEALIKLTKQVLNINLFFAMAALLGSCSTMYVPSNTNVPLLEGKGEKQVDAYASITGLHLTRNYAFSDKFSFMVNGSASYKYLGGTGAEGEFSTHYGNFAHRYGELGIGRYDIFKRKFKMEVFAGLGYGVADTDETILDINTLVKYKSNYALGFLQVNTGFRKGVFSVGGGLRLAYGSFDYTYPGEFTLPVAYHRVNFNTSHFEPLGFIRVGNETVKFVYRVSLSGVTPLNLPQNIDTYKGIIYGDFHATSLNLSVGINFSL